MNDLAGLLTYTTDSGESAYYDTIKMTRDYLEKMGEEKPAVLPTSRGTALYYYKQSLKYVDIEAARKYLDEYKKIGGKMSDVKVSIKRVDSLARGQFGFFTMQSLYLFTVYEYGYIN
ncbi:MAG: hypothetical protein HQL01_09340 [Nitrospirae bacterium]|nr:hypothetical protein [Nitrospirota bacterium]